MSSNLLKARWGFSADWIRVKGNADEVFSVDWILVKGNTDEVLVRITNLCPQLLKAKEVPYQLQSKLKLILWNLFQIMTKRVFLSNSFLVGRFDLLAQHQLNIFAEASLLGRGCEKNSRSTGASLPTTGQGRSRTIRMMIRMLVAWKDKDCFQVRIDRSVLGLNPEEKVLFKCPASISLLNHHHNHLPL